MVTTSPQVAAVPSPPPPPPLPPLKPPRKEDELPKPLQHGLTDAVAADTLTKLLVAHAEAHNPRDARIIAVTTDSVSIFYRQPVREYWFKPLDQTVTIRVAPALPPRPTHADAAWVAEVARRLGAFAVRNDVPVARFLPPRHWQELVTLAVFLGFSALVAAHIAGVRFVAAYVFTSERRFNIAVGVHSAVLIKRSRDARQLGELLAQHWRGGRAALLLWRLAGWVEGWRAVERFRAEAALVRLRLLAEEEEEKDAAKQAKESKKKR